MGVQMQSNVQNTAHVKVPCRAASAMAHRGRYIPRTAAVTMFVFIDNSQITKARSLVSKFHCAAKPHALPLLHIAGTWAFWPTGAATKPWGRHQARRKELSMLVGISEAIRLLSVVGDGRHAQRGFGALRTSSGSRTAQTGATAPPETTRDAPAPEKPPVGGLQFNE